MRLWLRLALVLALSGLLPLLVLGGLAIHDQRRVSSEDREKALTQDAERQAARISTWTLDQALTLHHSRKPYPQLATMAPELQSGFLRFVYHLMPSAVVVTLVDVDGIPVVPTEFLASTTERTPADGKRAQNLVARLPLTEATGDPTLVHIGDPYLPAGATFPSVPIALVASDDGSLILGAEIELTGALIEAETTDQRAYVLLDPYGALVVGQDHPLVRPELVRAMMQTRSNFAYQLPDGTQVQGASAQIADFGWTFVVLTPAATVQGSGAFGAAVITLVLLTFTVGFVGGNTVVDPVEELRDSVLAVAEGDYGKRTEIARSDEIGELAQAFNHMSERLYNNRAEIRAQQQEIEAFNEELQDRVERRTQELRDAQDQLVRSGQFAAVAEVGAGLAHELNNPLAAILGLSQVLRRKHADGPDGILLGDIEEQAARCREVVAAMLRFSTGQVDSGRAPVLDLRDVLADVCNLVRGNFRQRGVVLELIEAETPMRVRVDPVHGSRIFVQILNALRAGFNEGTHLRISAERVGTEVVVTLKPNADLLVDDLRHDDWMAAGMGLWVARQMLHELGGRLDQPLALPAAGTHLYTEETTETAEIPLVAAVPPAELCWRVVFRAA